MHIKTNDTVEVITGDDKGQRGKVLSIDRRVGRLVVEGVNRVYKHVRRSQKNPQGGRLSKEMPSPDQQRAACSATAAAKASAPASRIAKDGSKERFCKKCGTASARSRPPKRNNVAQAIDLPRRINRRSAGMIAKEPKSDKPKSPPRLPKPKGDKPPRRPRRQRREGPKGEKGDKKKGKAEAEEPAGPLPTPRLQEKYVQQVLPTLAEKFGRKNMLSLPRLEKIVVNMGVGAATQEKKHMEDGRRGDEPDHRPKADHHHRPQGHCRLPAPRRDADRLQGHPPRPQDVRVPGPADLAGPAPRPRLPRLSRKAFDGNGNYSLGLSEQFVFPELNPDKFTRVQGMNITFVIRNATRRRIARVADADGHAVPDRRSQGGQERAG